MTKQQIDALIQQAQQFIGQNVPVRIVDPNNSKKIITVPHTFNQISRGTGSAIGNSPLKYTAYGEVISSNGNKEIFPLKKIVDFFIKSQSKPKP